VAHAPCSITTGCAEQLLKQQSSITEDDPAALDEVETVAVKLRLRAFEKNKLQNKPVPT
jgi:hypothetical protein